MQPAAATATNEANRHLGGHEMAQLQQFMQGHLNLATLTTAEGPRLDAPHFPSTSAVLFSPTQQSRGDQPAADESSSPLAGDKMSDSAAKLLASAFLLDEREEEEATSQGAATGMASTTAADVEKQHPSGPQGNQQNGEEPEEANDGTEEEEEEEVAGAEEEDGREKCAVKEDGRAEGEQERRTSDLIRKQLAEIEKEIARRIQNKNVKKMDEHEMSQLLLDQGWVAELAAAADSQQQQQKSALPFNANNPAEQHTGPTPSLDQLRSQAISPPHQQPAVPLPTGFLPQPFTAAPFHFSHAAPPPEQFVQPQFAMAQSPPFAFSPYSAPFLPQQQSAAPPTASQSPSPPMAQMLPPNLSAITPEMAAALLAQLQQHNPGLLQNIVAQQQAQTPPVAANRISATQPVVVENGGGANGSSSTHAHPFPNPLPAPPRAAVAARRQPRRASISGATKMAAADNGGGMGEGQQQRTTMVQRQNSAEWSACNEGGGEAGAESMAAFGNGAGMGGGEQPVWVMRESYLKRAQREEQRRRQEPTGLENEEEAENRLMAGGAGADLGEEAEGETDRLLLEGGGGQKGGGEPTELDGAGDEQQQQEGGRTSRKGSKKEVIIHEPAVLIEGVLFRARYLGSTQMSLDGRPTKSSRMAQAQEAVARVKAPEGEPQPSTEIDLFISTEKIMVLNTDLQRISDTDVRQDILMDHSLRSISYIADIGDLVVLMARRVPSQQEQPEECDTVRKAARVICHVFESDESNFIAQSIGQAFQVAYVEFLRANGIEDPSYLRDIDYQEVLNSQEMMAEELELLARKETQKDVVVAKRSGEPLGVVVVESGWGSMLPTSVIANMAPGGAAARSNQLNIGDQIIGINGISLVGLPLSAAQQNIKNARSSTAVRLTIVSTPPVVEVRIRRPDTKYQLGFSVQNGVICSLLRGGIAERGGIRVGHRIIEINHQSVVAVPHERIVNMLATATGEIHMKTMPTSMFRLLTGQDVPNYI